MQFSFKRHDLYLELKMVGSPMSGEYHQVLDKLENSELWAPGDKLFVDLTEMSVSLRSIKNVMEVVDLVRRRNQVLGDAKIALHVSSDVIYGLARMFVRIAKPFWKASAEVFKARNVAIVWLIR